MLFALEYCGEGVLGDLTRPNDAQLLFLLTLARLTRVCEDEGESEPSISIPSPRPPPFAHELFRVPDDQTLKSLRANNRGDLAFCRALHSLLVRMLVFGHAEGNETENQRKVGTF